MNLVIVDDLFETFEGHPYAYDKAVLEICNKHGCRAVIYGHKKMRHEIRDELGAIPWFSINAQSWVRKIPILGAVLYRTSFWQKYKREIEEIIAENPDAFLFFPNVYWYNILPVARALKRNRNPSALLYRTSIFDTIRLPKTIQPATLALIRYSHGLLKNKSNIRFVTDSEVIAEEWQGYLKSGMSVLPIPHLTLNVRDPGMPANPKVRLYLPGGMRVEKGVRMLTEAFERLAVRDPLLLTRMELVTQFLGDDIALDSYKARLAALPVENVFLGRLSTEEYNRQLSLADVILIPYQVSEGYRARTSGILAEAIASSKPFITTEGTWMSVQAHKYDTGLTVRDEQPDDLAEAIGRMVAYFADYERKAIAASQKWMEAQSDNVFFSRLTGEIG